LNLGVAFQDKGTPQQVIPQPTPVAPKVDWKSAGSAVAAGLLGGVAAYLIWSKIYEYWKMYAAF
jgi:hypothetical protein